MAFHFLNFFKVEAGTFELYEYKPNVTPKPPEDTFFQVLNQLARTLTENEKIPVICVGGSICSPFKVSEGVYSTEVLLQNVPVTFSIELKQPDKIQLSQDNWQYTFLLNRSIDIIAKEFKMWREGQFLYEPVDILSLREKRIAYVTDSSAYEGYYRGVRLYSDLFLIVDPKYRVKSLRNLWEDVRSYLIYLKEDPYRPSQDAIKKLYQRFRGAIVTPEYEITRSAHKRIVEFDFSKTVDDESETSDGKWRGSPAKYQEMFGRKVKDHNQPQVRVRRPDGVDEPHVPELLRVTRTIEDLNRRVKSPLDIKAIVSIFRPKPDTRARLTVRFVRKISTPELAKWLKLSQEPLWVETKNFYPVRLEWADGEVLEIKQDKDFYNAFKSEKYRYLRTAPIKNVLIVAPREQEKLVSDFYRGLREVSGRKGQTLPEAEFALTSGVECEHFFDVLEDERIDLPHRDLVLTFATKDDEKTYNLIKKKLIVDVGSASQNVALETASKVLGNLFSEEPMKRGDAQTTLNLLGMQVVSKLGGAPWKFAEPLAPEGTIFIGLDIFHDPFRLKPSTAASCAVFDNTGEYIYGSGAIFQMMGRQSIEKIDQLTRLMIEHYQNKESHSPTYVIAFRHGVTPGFPMLEEEMDTFERILDEFGITQYAFITVTERTRIRMYSSPVKDWRKAAHPIPGSAVIGYPFGENQFSLQSSEAIGFGAPILVLSTVHRSKTPFKMEDYVKMGAWLARHHWASGRAVRIPVPIRYASQLAYFVGEMRAQPHERVIGTPFYL